MNGTHQVLAYANDIKGDDIRIERNADVLLNACKDIGLAVNTCKTKRMEIGRYQDMIANELIRIGSNSYDEVKTFKYFESLVTNENYIQDEIKCRLKAGNSCYYSVQTLWSPRLLSENLKIKIYNTIILPIVLYSYGFEASTLTIKEECMLRVFENMILG